MLNFPPTQAEYDAWNAAKHARASDPQDPYHQADVNDCNMIAATALEIWYRQPEYREALRREAPAIIERAGEELGLFTGAAALGAAIGMAPTEATKIMLGLFDK